MNFVSGAVRSFVSKMLIESTYSYKSSCREVFQLVVASFPRVMLPWFTTPT